MVRRLSFTVQGKKFTHFSWWKIFLLKYSYLFTFGNSVYCVRASDEYSGPFFALTLHRRNGSPWFQPDHISVLEIHLVTQFTGDGDCNFILQPLVINLSSALRSCVRVDSTEGLSGTPLYQRLNETLRAETAVACFLKPLFVLPIISFYPDLFFFYILLLSGWTMSSLWITSQWEWSDHADSLWCY